MKGGESLPVQLAGTLPWNWEGNSRRPALAWGYKAVLVSFRETRQERNQALPPPRKSNDKELEWEPALVQVLDRLPHTSHHQAGLKAATRGRMRGKILSGERIFILGLVVIPVMKPWLFFRETHQKSATGPAASRATALQPALPC